MTSAEANRVYFDTISDTYDSKPFFRTVNQKVTDDLRTRLHWFGIPFPEKGTTSEEHSVRHLDYACGTGFMSRILAPYVTETRAIDVSPNMVTTYNARAHAAGFSTDVMKAVVGDLLDAENPSPMGAEWDGFDVATAGFAFHHFDDVVLAARRLKERLRPGGVVVISDFLEGGDLKADEEGNPVEGSEGTWAVHHHHGNGHGHGHGHGHGNGHGHGHGHGHGYGHEEGQHRHHNVMHAGNDGEFPHNKMKASIRVEGASFTVEGVKRFFIEAGLIDVDVVTMQERVYMEFAGQKLWRTVLFARGRRPAEAKSEL